MEKVVDHYGPKLRLVVKFAPYPYRDNATHAARAALAAGAQNAYWPMHTKLLEHYRELNPENLVRYAAELGLDAERFRRDLEAEWTAKRVAEDVALARSIDIWQTPTYLINGRQVVGERPFEHLVKVIDEELGAAGR